MASDGSERVDLTIFGAGIFGLATAYAAGRRGAKVRVIDPQGPGGGASGGFVGALAPHAPGGWDPLKTFQLRALAMAPDFWAGVQRLGGVDPGYARTGRLQPLADAAAVDRAAARAREAAERWPADTTWEVVDAPDPQDAAQAWAPVSPTGRLIRDTLTARVHPPQALAALAAAIAQQGGELVRQGPVQGAVLRATGVAGLTELSLLTGKVWGDGVKGQAALLRHAADGRPQVAGPGLYIVPHMDGTVAVGSTSERDFESPASVDDRLEDVIERARAILPVLAKAPVIGRWAGLRPRATGRLPLLGRDPVRSGAYIANGGFKIGFGLAPLVGEVMADLILDGRETMPPEFSTARLM